MTKGPLTGNHPKKAKTFPNGVYVYPDPEPTWDRKTSYFVEYGGEPRGMLVYHSGQYSRGWEGRSLLDSDVKWKGSKSRGPKTCVYLGDATFAGCVDKFPFAVEAGQFPTAAEVGGIVAQADRDLAAKAAEDEAERAVDKFPFAVEAGQFPTAAEDEAKPAALAEALEGLRSIRDTFGAALSNHEMSALKSAIVRLGGGKDE